MALILQDTMLEKLLCSVCEKYLSALPVKVYHGGIIKCGRCCTTNDGGTISLYDSVVENYFFKCVNRHEGCNKLLKPSEVLSHEKNCISGSYNCPKCHYNFWGTAYELVQHYKKWHPNSILIYDNFNIFVKQVFKERYLYIIEDNIFLILVENMPSEKILYLSAVSLKSCINAKQQFFLKLFGKDKVNFKTDVTQCYSLEGFKCDYFKIETGKSSTKINCQFRIDLSQVIRFANEISLCSEQPIEEVPEHKSQESKSLQTIPVEDMFGVTLTNKFKEEYPSYKLTPCGTALFKDNGQRIELTCANCRQFTGSNVFNCEFNKHVVCWECNEWCGICDSQAGGWSVEISSANELLLLPCKWKCGLNFSGDNLRSHEAACKNLLKKCPERLCRTPGCSWLQLKTHMKRIHNIEFLTQISLTKYLKENNKSVPLYFIKNDYLFKMAWVKLQNVYELYVKSCEKINDYELVVLFDNKTYKKLIENKISFTLDNNPKFYLKRIK